MTPADSASFRSAVAEYDAGNTKAAAATLVRLAHTYPRIVEAQSAAGMCLLEAGDIAAGVPLLEASLRLDPAQTQIKRNLALGYVQLGRWQQAAGLLQQVTAATPDDSGAWFALGQSQRALQHLPAAVQAFERAAALAGHEPAASGGAALPDVLYDWAEAELASNQPGQAITLLRRLPAAAPDPQVLLLRADAEERTGEYQAAVEDFRAAAETGESEATVAAYGEELLRHWTFAPAVTVLEYAGRRYPASERLRLDLGIAYFGENDFAKAGDLFGALLAQHPDDERVAELLGRSCDALAQQRSGACAQLTSFAEAHPHNAPAALYAAIALQQASPDEQGRAQAQMLLTSALVADPRLARAWFQQGVLQQARLAWADSAVSLERALALEPAFPEAHYRLSRAYAHLGRAEDARAQMGLHQQAVETAKQAETQRMQGVLTFLTVTH